MLAIIDGLHAMRFGELLTLNEHELDVVMARSMESTSHCLQKLDDINRQPIATSAQGWHQMRSKLREKISERLPTLLKELQPYVISEDMLL